MTLHPPTDPAVTRRYKTGFISLSVASLGLIAWQGVRGSNEHDADMRATLGDPERPPILDIILLPDLWVVVVSNETETAAYNVNIEVTDASESPCLSQPIQAATYPEITPHTAPILARQPPPNGQQCRLRVLLRTRRGLYDERMLMWRLPDNQWGRMLKVTNDSGVLIERGNQENGRIDWPTNF
jgi:hypothetical protein